VKVLELTVENLRGVPDGAYSFSEPDGSARQVVALAGTGAGVLLETLAALLEGMHGSSPTGHLRAWWAQRRRPREARLWARWALSEGEAARARLCGRTMTAEWRFGPLDELPREVHIDGALSRGARADVAQYVHLDANRSAVWIGGPNADTMAEALAQIAERAVAATQAWCLLGRGLIAWKTPAALAELTRAIAPILPALRLARVTCKRGGMPVGCFRADQRVEFDELTDAERDAVYIVTVLHTARVRDGVILVDSPEVRVPREERARWRAWLADLAAGNQLFLAGVSEEVPSVQLTDPGPDSADSLAVRAPDLPA
jgi:hypothetical protein